MKQESSRGKTKWFKKANGFGYIARENNDDIFVRFGVDVINTNKNNFMRPTYRPTSSLIETPSMPMRNGPTFFTATKPTNLAIDQSTEPPYYYHSTGAMNPMKLIGILKHGILSKSQAESKGLSIDANGLQCNGTNFVSVATILGGCMCRNTGAFNFGIERKKLTSYVRKNPEQDMPLERQVYSMVPKDAITGIYLEKEGFTDIGNADVKLGIGSFVERASKQSKSYTDFMINEFDHHLSDSDQASIQTALVAMKKTEEIKEYFEKRNQAEKQENIIDNTLKKNLKYCYQQKIMKDAITPYDIVRYHDQDIPVYDATGKLVVQESNIQTQRGFSSV